MEPSTQEFFRKLVAAKSVSSKDSAIDTSNQQAADVVAEMLTEFGFTVSQQEVPGLVDKVNAIATAGPQQPGKGLILAGHTDTVPCTPESWDSDPFSLTKKDDYLYGLGACDMKGFFPVIREALLHIDLAQLKAPLQVWATANEECGMEGAEHIAKTQPPAQAVLLGEPTSLQPVYGHKGALAEEIICHGKSGHASVPANGANAIEALLHVMNALKEDFEKLANEFNDQDFQPPQPTMNFGMIEGGDAFNRIPDRACLWVDRRLMPNEEPATVRQHIRDIATQATKDLPGITIEFKPLVAGFTAVRTPSNAPIVQAAEKISGKQAYIAPYATEAPYYANAGMDVVVMGAGDIKVIHQPNECIAIEQIDMMAQYTKQLIEQFCLHD